MCTVSPSLTYCKFQPLHCASVISKNLRLEEIVEGKQCGTAIVAEVGHHRPYFSEIEFWGSVEENIYKTDPVNTRTAHTRKLPS
ncbi:hypothetical protein L2E82_12848 [Cichorium intybus]|uniref:Uncharacterized protein n=1 Tax=Cichorium intybus TaxID=13427 RepID=A0ACB9GHC5_CICIN|nr:hypothetical protein L2E82_12848 [Cichorium intybus]